MDKDNEIKKKALDLREYCLSHSNCHNCCFSHDNVGMINCEINSNPKTWREEWALWSVSKERNCSKCKKHLDIINPKTGNWYAYFCKEKSEIVSYIESSERCNHVCWNFEGMEE